MLGKNGGPSKKGHAQDGGGSWFPTLDDEENRYLRSAYSEE
jgi:hypothetical protein